MVEKDQAQIPIGLAFRKVAFAMRFNRVVQILKLTVGILRQACTRHFPPAHVITEFPSHYYSFLKATRSLIQCLSVLSRVTLI